MLVGASFGNNDRAQRSEELGSESMCHAFNPAGLVRPSVSGLFGIPGNVWEWPKNPSNFRDWNTNFQQGIVRLSSPLKCVARRLAVGGICNMISRID
jgi:formylglycine-generating enzyme required for sulfatase activity